MIVVRKDFSCAGFGLRQGEGRREGVREEGRVVCDASPGAGLIKAVYFSLFSGPETYVRKGNF